MSNKWVVIAVIVVASILVWKKFGPAIQAKTGL